MNDYDIMLAQYFGAKKYTLFQRIKRWFVKIFESNHQRLTREGKEHQENVARAYKLFNDKLKKPNMFLNIFENEHQKNIARAYKLNSNDPKNIFTDVLKNEDEK